MHLSESEYVSDDEEYRTIFHGGNLSSSLSPSPTTSASNFSVPTKRLSIKIKTVPQTEIGQAALKQLTQFRPIQNTPRRKRHVKRDSFSDSSYFDQPKHQSWDDSKFRKVAKYLRDSYGLKENTSLERDLHRLLQQYKDKQEVEEEQKRTTQQQQQQQQLEMPIIRPPQKTKSEGDALSLSMPVYNLKDSQPQSTSMPSSPINRNKHKSWAKPKVRLAMPQDRRAVYLSCKHHAADLQVFHNPLYRVKLPTISRVIRLPSKF